MPTDTTGHGRVTVVIAVTIALLAALAPVSQAQQQREFPSDDPDVRAGTPNDPEFDCAESDDPDTGGEADCGIVWDEQHNLFGFPPDSTRQTATYKAGPRTGQGQISGTSVDRAWKTTIGSPDVAVAILDTGIEWSDDDLRTQIDLNEGELPTPEGADTHDANGDGAVNVLDYQDDPRVTDTNGHPTDADGNPLIDGQDVIRAFSDGTDDDGNGYVDDIAGWDFFDDDNDPADVSSYSSAEGHGTGRAAEAAQATHDRDDEAAVCPKCQVMPLRVWDSFVVPGDQYGMATVYAADNGADVQEVALGVLSNSSVNEAATEYAYDEGLALMQVSSDLNSANHNYPTNYHETTYINGCVADAEGLGQDFEFNEDNPSLSEFLAEQFGIGTQVPVQTWFRNSNLTQYGAHAHVCMKATTGSVATGQAAGAAGLIVSRGQQLARAGQLDHDLTSNEIKQLLTMSAEDVLPANTLGLGTPDPAQAGWDRHFGYGRANIGAAVEAVGPGTIPPEALIDIPTFWSILDPRQGDVPVTGRVAADRAQSYDYRLQWAPGVEPANDAFRTVATGSGTDATDGRLGTLPMDEIAAALPGSMQGTPPEGPNSYAFTVRVVVTDDAGNRGEDRKAYFAFHDPTLHAGWPRTDQNGGESTPVLYDLNGDGDLEVIEADSSGRLIVRGPDGAPAGFFNGGEPWVLPATYNAHLQAPGYTSGAVPPPTGGWRDPAVADIDADLSPEIVAPAADGRLFVFERDGSVADGFPVAVDPRLSRPAVRTEANHVKRGFQAGVSLGDLDGDSSMEIVAPALDGHVYVWNADGRLRDGFPKQLSSPPEGQDFYGGELIATATLADLDGNDDLEIVVESSEVYGGSTPDSAGDLQEAVAEFVANGTASGTPADSFGRIYALHDDGTAVDGWPAPLPGLLPDLLPYVMPSLDAAAADTDDDGADEIVAGVASGTLRLLDGDGSEIRQLNTQGPVVGGDSGEIQHVNLVSYPAVGDLTDDGTLEVAKGGATLNTAVNLLAVGQNLPFDHLAQVWDADSGIYTPGYPRPNDDFLLLSSPAIADVSASSGRELLMGSGLYLVHAFGPQGLEAAGFPKLAGGWLVATPTVGDVDADGELELLASTREGGRFLWDLDAEASPDANDQWWTKAHDQCNSQRHGTDCRPPSPAREVELNRNGSEVTFTAPGDDWLVGTAERYQIRVSPQPIDDFSDWQAATPVDEVPEPDVSGSEQTAELPAGTRAVAVVTTDEAGNASMLATDVREPRGRPPRQGPANAAPTVPRFFDIRVEG